MASGDTLCVFFPNDGIPPDTNPATPDTRGGAANTQQEVLDFNDTTAESIDFSGFMPRNYSATTGVTVTIGWMATDTTVTPHTVEWTIAFKSVSDDADDLDTKAFPTAQAVSDTEASASGEVTYTTQAITNAATAFDGVAAGEFFRLRISRNPAGTDTLTDDAELVFVEIQET